MAELEKLVTTNSKKLYDAVSSKYEDIGDWETFRTKISEPENRKKLYDAVSKDFEDIGTFEEFEGKLAPEVNNMGTPWRSAIFGGIPKAAAGAVRSLGQALETNFPVDEFNNFAPGPSRLTNIPGAEFGSKVYEQTAQALEGAADKMTEAVGAREATGPRYVDRKDFGRFVDPKYAYKAFAESLPLTASLALSRGSMVPMTLIEAGDALADLKAKAAKTGQAMTPEQENILSGVVGLVNGKLEQLGLESMFKGIRRSGATGVIKDAVIAMFTEGPTEGLQQLDQSLAVAIQDGYMSQDEAEGILSSITATLSDPKVWQDVSEASFGGVLVGAGASVITAPLKRSEAPRPEIANKVDETVTPIDQATATKELEDLRNNAPDSLKEIFDEEAERAMDEESEAKAKTTERQEAKKARKQTVAKEGATGTAEDTATEGTPTGEAGSTLDGEGADSGVRGNVAEKMNPQVGGKVAEEVEDVEAPKRSVMDEQPYRMTQAKRELEQLPSDNTRKRNEGVRQIAERAVDPERAKSTGLRDRLRELHEVEQTIYEHLFPEGNDTSKQFDAFQRDIKPITDEIERLEGIQEESYARRKRLRDQVDKIFAGVEGPQDTADAIKQALELEEQADQIDVDAYRGAGRGDKRGVTVPVGAKQVATTEKYAGFLKALQTIFPGMDVTHVAELLDVDPETKQVLGNILGAYKDGKVWVAGTKKGQYVEFGDLEADTLGHEAFHYWWRLVADKPMRDMAEKVFSDSKYKDVEYESPEEAMAEAIKDYLRGRLEGPRSLRVKVRDYLKYVVARIKEFVGKGNKDDVLRILTENLVQGGQPVRTTLTDRIVRRKTVEGTKAEAEEPKEPKKKKRKEKVTFSKSVLKEDRKLWDRFVDTFSTTNRYERLDAPNTAKAIKGFYGNIDQIADKLKAQVAEMAKLANNDMSLLRDAILSRDSRKYRASLSTERKELIRALITRLDAFYDDIFEQYKEMGILKEKFHEKRLREALAKLKRVRSDKSRAVILKDIEAIVDSGYVPIPYKVWFRKLSTKGKLTEEAVNAFVNFAGAKGRTTIRIADLIESGVIKKEDVNWSAIMSDYIYRVSRDFAQMQVIEAAKKDKLVVSPSGVIPWNYVRLPINAEHMNPKVVYAHPSIVEFWKDLNTWHVSAMPYKFLAMTKMMQFIEPYILAMYNIAQTAIVTGPWTITRPDRTMAAFAKAARMMKEQDEEYQAIIPILSSTPYANPVESLYRDVDRASRGNLIVGPLKSYVAEVIDNKMLAPWITVRSLYEASWTIAWQGDRFLRLYTYNMLRSSGMGMEEAASLAAQALGDYAAVPGKTRKFLNTIFFTPTFQIAMGKFWFKMIKEAIRMPLQLVGGPKLTQYERRLAMSAFTVVAMNVGFHMLMSALGFEPDETGARVFGVNVKKWFLTYRKTVETDKGKREVVVTVSNPVNFPLKYFYRFMETFSPAETKPVMRLLRVHAWQLHPVLRVATQLATQTKLNGQPIIAPNESTSRVIFENTRFAGTELVRAFKPLSDQDDFEKSDEIAGRALRRELGWTFDIMTAAWATRYTRQPIAQRFRRQAKTLAEDWKSYYYSRAMYEFGMGAEYNVDMEALKRQEANLRKKINKLMEFADELDKEEKSGK